MRSSSTIRLSWWKNELACLPDIETVCFQNLGALEKQITLRIVGEFGRVAGSARARKQVQREL